SLTVDGNVEAAPGNAQAYLERMRQILGATPRLLPHFPELPLSGGLVGASAYDLVRYFERLPNEPAGDTVLARYVAPQSLLVFDHASRRAALLHAGTASERRQLRAQVVEALRGPVSTGSSDSNNLSWPQASMDQNQFIDAVFAAKDYITAGDIFQIVLSVRFSGTTDISAFEAYRALRLLNPSPYMFFLDLGDTQIVGSSPEALVRLNGREAALRPIAGTRPRGQDRNEDQALEGELLLDEKENAEHIMLVDLARNDLGRVAIPGTIRVDPLRSIERYSHVMHIVSGVNGELAADQDAFDLFKAAFPAGTLVGAPKVRAMQLIDELEPTPRAFYGGTVGYFDRGGNLDQAITIRTLVFQNGRYSFQAGAGIVADSDPETEHAEVLAKSAVLRRALEMARVGL
ncbi:MAG: anthranilate synthase component I family protein, partial [Gammaproteobacteria bacterium]